MENKKFDFGELLRWFYSEQTSAELIVDWLNRKPFHYNEKTEKEFVETIVEVFD